MMGRVVGAICEVEEPGFVGIDLLIVANKANALVGEIL